MTSGPPHEPVREPRDLPHVAAAQLSRPRLVRFDELPREPDPLTGLDRARVCLVLARRPPLSLAAHCG